MHAVSGSIHDRFPLAFRQRCAEKLEQCGDVAAGAQRHDDAIIQYSVALSLDLPIPYVFIKRSKVYMAKGLWEEALHDANQVRPCYFECKGPVLIDAELLGNNPGSILSIRLREGVDGVGKSEFEEWIVERRFVCRS